MNEITKAKIRNMEYEIRNRNDSTYLLEIAAALLDLDSLSDIEHKRLSEVMAFVSAAAEALSI